MSPRAIFKTLCLAFSLATLSIPGYANQYAEHYVTIGTGGVTGVYYPTGNAICRIINKYLPDYHCTAEATGGSIFNLNAIRNGEMDFAIVQADAQYNAYEGMGPFASKGANEQLQALFSIYTEIFTIVARADSKIYSLNDLKDKRVNIGNPGSGQRATMEALMKQMGWKKDAFKIASGLIAKEQARALCDNKIDAFVYMVGHPSAVIQEAANTCHIRLIDVTGDAVHSLRSSHPFYVDATIPAGMYRDNPEPIISFGVKATFVTSDLVPEDESYRLVKAIFDNFDQFKHLHPMFKRLTHEKMLEGNTAPFAPGAKRFYDEKQWLKNDTDTY